MNPSIGSSLVRSGDKGIRIVVVALACGGMLAMLPAMADSKAAPALPEFLKDMKQATGSCPRDDLPTGSIIDRNRSDKAVPDLTCAIAPDEFLQLQNRKGSAEIVVVDTRRSAEYQEFHIDGALNIDTSGIRSKGFLKNKNIVLIGNGKAERELFAACAELKSQGFKQVKVLRGGMPLWLFSGGSAVGRIPEIAQLSNLDSAEFLIESEFNSNIVLLHAPQPSLRTVLRFSTPLAELTPDAIKVVLTRWRKETRNMGLASLVLVTEHKLDDESLRAIRRSTFPVPVLVYRGTQESVIQQQKQQKALWAAQARGPKRPRCGL